MPKEIVVSISCITYNHAPYIRQCLDGFMMQQTDFAYEVLIHDDASTDGTTEIIKEYETKYPDIIKPIYEEENQWVKGRKGSAVFNFPRAKGKYIALCEGDDYWTDPLKLQKQVDILEGNLNYSICCHKYQWLNDSDLNICVSEDNEVILPDSSFNLDTLLNSRLWIIQPLTVVFRKNMFDLNEYQKYAFAKDVTLFYHLLKKGDAYLMSDIMGIYRIHDGGAFSNLSWANKLLDDLRTILGISEVENDERSANYLQWAVDRVISNLGRKEILKQLNLFYRAESILSQYYGKFNVYKTILTKMIKRK